MDSWTSYEEAVQHGYLMLFELNNESLASGDLLDYFYSVTVDVAEHSAYAAAGHYPNCTLRLLLFEYSAVYGYDSA